MNHFIAQKKVSKETWPRYVPKCLDLQIHPKISLQTQTKLLWSVQVLFAFAASQQSWNVIASQALKEALIVFTIQRPLFSPSCETLLSYSSEEYSHRTFFPDSRNEISKKRVFRSFVSARKKGLSSGQVFTTWIWAWKHRIYHPL